MKKGAIFDQDGLLFDTEAIFARSWVEAGRQMGFEVPPAFCTAVSGSSGPDMERIVQTYFPHIDYRAYIDLLFQISYAEQARHLPEKPGAQELVRYLKQQGCKLAVASSSHRDKIQSNLERTGLAEIFDVVVSGQDVTAGKPNPDIFLLAAQKLGLPPEDCYVFEDSFNGVRAGHAAGCYTVMVPDLIQPDAEISRLYDACCPSLLDAMARIQTGQL